jgi:hypothetical protein
LAIAALEGGTLRRLADSDLDDETLHALVARRSHRPLNPYLRGPDARRLAIAQR